MVRKPYGLGNVPNDALLARESVVVVNEMRRAPVSGAFLLALLGLLTAIEVTAIDVYMPALPRLQQLMHVSPAQAGLTLSIFLAGIAIGQAIYGPLSDRYGRRRPLIVGLCIYTLASAMPLLGTSFGWFLSARLLQALGAAAGLVISRAVVTDCFSDEESPRAYSILMQILGLTATLAPLLGGYLISNWGWQSIAGTLTAIGFICFLLVGTYLQETLPVAVRASGRVADQRDACVSLLLDRPFAAFTMALAATMAAMFMLLAGSAFVVIQQFQWTPASYSMLYGLGAFGFILAGYANTRALSRRSAAWLLRRSVTLQALLALALVMLPMMRDPTPWLFAMLMTIFLSNLGFICGNLNALAMARARTSAGIGSSLIGVSQFAVSAGAGGIAAVIGGSPLTSTTLTIGAFSLMALVSYGIGEWPSGHPVTSPTEQAIAGHRPNAE
jgi:MFS transporter, DHA1 family, multidrug resistance protein